jgi:hypothetical protein
VGSVVLCEVRIRLRVAQVVDGYDLNVMLFATFVMSTQNIATDTTIPVNSNTNRHGTTPFLFKVYRMRGYKTRFTKRA